MRYMKQNILVLKIKLFFPLFLTALTLGGQELGTS